MSANKVGSILRLFTSKSGTSERFSEQQLILDTNGVVDDKFYAKSPERSVLIASTDSYELVSRYGIEMPYGYLGENILIDFNPYSLDVGTKIKMGGAILEISQHCTICNHLTTIDVKIPTLLKNDRGVFAKVVQDGKTNVGDGVYLGR
jgi:MOSC domain-containing protein YiiM